MSEHGRSRLSFDDLLDSVPVPNEAVEVERDIDDEASLRLPIRRAWFMHTPLRWIMPFRKHRTILLDGLGHEVWSACDGKRRTEEVIELFAKRHHLSFHEARLSVSQFLRSLVQRRLIAMVGAEEAAS